MLCPLYLFINGLFHIAQSNNRAKSRSHHRTDIYYTDMKCIRLIFLSMPIESFKIFDIIGTEDQGGELVNKKLTVRNKFGEIVSCVLSDKESFEKQMMEVLSLHAGCGFSVDFRTDSVVVKDYFTNETVGAFEILSFVETDESVVLNWQK